MNRGNARERVTTPAVSLHCGTNVQREVPDTYNWWEAAMNLISGVGCIALVTCLSILSICQDTSAMAQAFEESLEQARANARASVDDQFIRWQDWQGLEKVAEDLAKVHGDQAISHIEQLVDKHGARVVTDDRLLGVTLAKICRGNQEEWSLFVA